MVVTALLAGSGRRMAAVAATGASLGRSCTAVHRGAQCGTAHHGAVHGTAPPPAAPRSPSGTCSEAREVAASWSREKPSRAPFKSLGLPSTAMEN